MMLKYKISNLYHGFKKYCRIVIKRELYFPIDINIEKETLGSWRAQWTLSSRFLDDKKIVYSFGVGSDISFDKAIIEKYRCHVFAFDPTPKSVAWIRSQELPTEFHFLDYGISDQDDLITFYPPGNPEFVSFSIKPEIQNQEGVKLQVFRLLTIMTKLGHTNVDLVKLDIEGSEYPVIQDMLKSGIYIKQLLVEFHHRFSQYTLADTKIAIESLHDAGYKILYVSPNGEEYSFIKGE